MRSWLGRFSARIGIGGYIGGVVMVAAIVLALPLLALAERGIGGWWLGLLALLGLIPAIDAAMALVNRGCHERVRRDDPAGPGAARRRTVAPAHAGRRPDPAHDAGRARRADRAPGDPPPRQPGRRASFRAALGLDGRRDRDRRGRRRAPRRGRRGHRPPQSPLRTGRRRGPLPPAPSPAGLERRAAAWIGWERKRGKLHELNRLLRGATDTTFMAVGGTPARPARRRPLRHHARRRYAAAAGNGPAAGRQDGAPAQPSALRRRHAARRRGIRRAAAARHALAADRPRGVAVPAHLLQHERHRSLRRRRVRRVPGSLRRRLLCRQGHLRRRCLRSRARRPRAAKARCSVTICSRAPSPAPAWLPISRSSRSFRRATTSPPRASTAGRAATGNCCRGFSVAATRPPAIEARARFR